VYRYILQKHYGVTVSELALVVLHPDNPTWRVVRLNLLDDEVLDMMASRKRALEVPGNDGLKPVVVFEEEEAGEEEEEEEIPVSCLFKKK